MGQTYKLSVEKVQRFDNIVFTSAEYFNSNYFGLILMTVHTRQGPTGDDPSQTLVMHVLKDLISLDGNQRRAFNTQALGLYIPRNFVQSHRINLNYSSAKA